MTDKDRPPVRWDRRGRGPLGPLSILTLLAIAGFCVAIAWMTAASVASWSAG